jgi:hypothetical protein
VTDLPRYRATDDDAAAPTAPDAATAPRSHTKVVLVIIGIALVAVMIGLHLAGGTPH